MAPEKVVDAALTALERGRIAVIPGRRNRALANLPRLAPRRVVARMAERTLRPGDERAAQDAARA
jgi:short-subunit dehydrogenase